MKEEDTLINEGTFQEYDYNNEDHECEWKRVHRGWPPYSASHRGAYAKSKNTDKYKEVTALNTAPYGNFLWH